jgi:hypothetical protein
MKWWVTMKFPASRDKYVDEAVGGILFIFGEYEDGTVDINNSGGEVFERVPKDIAEKVVEANRAYMERLYSLLMGSK